MGTQSVPFWTVCVDAACQEVRGLSALEVV